MSQITIYLLNPSKNIKGEIKLKKPKTYQDLLKILSHKLKKNLSNNYDIFIVDKNNKEITINNEENYKKIEDILLIREIDKNMEKQSFFKLNYNKLSESKKERLEEKYNCLSCLNFIENENPYLCYKCQKIFHEKCLKDWDKKCKSQNKILSCPNCRNELPIEKWNKKINYEDSIKETEYFINNLNTLNDHKMKQTKLISRYEKYLQITMDIFKNILIKLNKINSMLGFEYNYKINNLIELCSLKVLEIHQYDLKDISIVIDEELEIFIKFILNFNINEVKKKICLNENIEDSFFAKNQILIQNNMNKINNININMNNNKDKNIINNKKIIGTNEINNMDDNKSKFEEIKINEYKNRINLIYYAKSKDNYNIFGKNFVKNNKGNIELIINNNQNILISNSDLNEGENIITIIIKNKLNNLSSMFYGCKSLKDITELKYLDVKDNKDFSHIFYSCSSLLDINSLQNWNVSNGSNFSYMFCGCSSLSDIRPLQNWNVSNSNDFSYTFSGCSSLLDIKPLQNWNVSRVNSFYRMFCRCTSLSEINALQNWNVSNCINFSYMFQGCSSLLRIESLKNWNVSKCNNFKGMFNQCSALSDIKPLEKWNVSKGDDFKDMFSGCSSLSDIGILHNWNISKENLTNIKVK